MSDLNEEPPRKKRKLSHVSVSLELKTEDTIPLKIQTKLGESRTILSRSGLRLVECFNNQLSGRWRIQDGINIHCEDVSFTTEDVEALIFYKKENKINIHYPYRRLIYLCNAMDYLTETIDAIDFQKTIQTYCTNAIPAIGYNSLLQLESLCTNAKSTFTTALATAIEAQIQRMNARNDAINNKTIKNWNSVPFQLLTAKSRNASTVFINNFVFGPRIECRVLKPLWKHICQKLLWTQYPAILDTVYQFKTTKEDSVFTKTHARNAEISAFVTEVVTDTLEICCQNDLKYTANDNYAMLTNVLKTMANNVHSFEQMYNDTKRSECAKGVFRYDSLIAILRTLIGLRQRMNGAFTKHFGNDIIIALLNSEFQSTICMTCEPFYSKKYLQHFHIKQRPVLQDIEVLNEALTKTEQFALFKIMLKCHVALEIQKDSLTNILKSLIDIGKSLPDQTNGLLVNILENYNSLTKVLDVVILKDLLKTVIEIDYDETFKLARTWFPVLMRSHKNWIIEEIPKTSGMGNLLILIDAICSYFMKHSKDSIGDYFDFVNLYTHVWDPEHPIQSES